jgi:REP element-mobilizing transposase RayT
MGSVYHAVRLHPGYLTTVFMRGFRTTGATHHRLRYHVLLVTWRRKPHFAEAAVAERVGALLTEIAGKLGCAVLGVEVTDRAVYLQLDAPPELAPSRLATRLRMDSAHALSEPREVFEALRGTKNGLWTRETVVSTRPLSEGVRGAFVDARRRTDGPNV